MTMAEGSGTFLGSREPVLPPGFSLHVLSEGDAFSHALAQGPIPRCGSAGLATAPGPARFRRCAGAGPAADDSATVPLCGHECRRDAFSVHCPPEKAIRFQWPDALTFDLGLIGGGRTAWPEACARMRCPTGSCSVPRSVPQVPIVANMTRRVSGFDGRGRFRGCRFRRSHRELLPPSDAERASLAE